MLLSFYSDFSCSETPDSFCFTCFEYFLITASVALTSFLFCELIVCCLLQRWLSQFLWYEAYSSSNSQAYFESRFFFLLQTVWVVFFLLLTLQQIKYQFFSELTQLCGVFLYWKHTSLLGKGSFFCSIEITIALTGSKQGLLAKEISDTCQLKIECTVENSIRDYHNIIFQLSFVKS